MLDRSVRRPGRRMFLAIVAPAAVAIATMSSVGHAGPVDSKSELPVDRGVMQRVADFTLDDVATGRPVSLYSFVGKRAIVLVFLGTDCPVGNLYVPRLIELNREFKGDGVIFLGLNSNAHEDREQVAKYVKETGIDFPVLKDVQNKVSDTVLAERTCEALVLDGFARIRYRGAIDDQYVQGKAKDKPQHTYLKDALESDPEEPADQGDRDARRRLPAGPGRSQAGRIDQGPASPGAFPRDRQTVRRPRRREAGQGRRRDLCRGRRGDHPGTLPVLPSAGPGRAVRPDELRRRAEAFGDDPRGGRGAPDAPLARRPALRPLRQ